MAIEMFLFGTSGRLEVLMHGKCSMPLKESTRQVAMVEAFDFKFERIHFLDERELVEWSLSHL